MAGGKRKWNIRINIIPGLDQGYANQESPFHQEYINKFKKHVDLNVCDANFVDRIVDIYNNPDSNTLTILFDTSMSYKTVYSRLCRVPEFVDIIKF